MKQYDKLEEVLNNILFMEILTPHYQTELEKNAELISSCEETYVKLYVKFDKERSRKKEMASAKIKEELDDRIRENNRKEEIERGRAEREEARAEQEERMMTLNLQIIEANAAAAAAAAAHDAHAGVPVDPDPPAAPPVPHEPPRRFQEVKSMHPGKISIESTPQEMRVFITNYQSWYQISNVDTLNHAQQISTLRTCCSEGIQERIDWVEQSDIDMALESLRGLFLVDYPIITRHLEYLKNTQTENESVEDFIL